MTGICLEIRKIITISCYRDITYMLALIVFVIPISASKNSHILKI